MNSRTIGKMPPSIPKRCEATQSRQAGIQTELCSFQTDCRRVDSVVDVTFQDRLGPGGERLLNRLADSLDTFHDIAINMEPIRNSDGTRETFADPGVIGLSQIHHNRFGVQCQKVGMLASIDTQILE
ncbi:hypothetical protein QD47_20280 [Paenibacillus terrae]|uniref:Uncharacterized protein n=1 Tax=Paenibacillus terrae TaxID=159743 RepID=A0A0D7X1G9_9BACL|nr:hypothetical protein [Paenibacillus terrae]KJD43867.1 hypothetical protein QD47_20280 [Paenibacillus terrae]